MFHRGWREIARRLASSDLDLVIVGGGITGCGIALDAAQRGLRVMVVEKADIASGTSSRSSKLIHGGLRYLKQMQFRVTRAACRERDRLVALNPHLVHRIRFLYPAWHGDRTPGWQVDLGLWMYDQLTGNPEKHVQIGKTELRSLAPGLQTQGLDRVLAYTDAMADDARLTHAVAATAWGYGAGILTRAELEGPVFDGGGRIAGLVVHDLEHDDHLEIRAKLIVNATGVWTDAVRERLGLMERHLRPSRGIHVILPRRAIPVTTAVSFPAGDGRPVFLIPHPEGTLLGTTDLYHDGGLDDPRPVESEIEYLLSAVRGAFPRTVLRREEVRGAFAGLRPILDTHADEPSEASREEDVWFENGVLSVAGGKLTTWRSMAETAVDAVLSHLPEERARYAGRCRTAGTPLAGLAPADLADRLIVTGIADPEVAAGMARRLGGLAWPARDLARDHRDLQPLVDGCDLGAAEVRAHLRWGAVVRLEDLLLRRARFGMWRPDLAEALVGPTAELAADELGWDHSRRSREEDGCRAALNAWRLPDRSGQTRRT